MYDKERDEALTRARGDCNGPDEPRLVWMKLTAREAEDAQCDRSLLLFDLDLVHDPSNRLFPYSIACLHKDVEDPQWLVYFKRPVSDGAGVLKDVANAVTDTVWTVSEPQAFETGEESDATLLIHMQALMAPRFRKEKAS